MTLGDLNRGAPAPGADRKRKLGVLGALAMVILVLVGIGRLAGGDAEVDDTTPPTTEPAEAPGTTEGDTDADGFAYGGGGCPPPEKPEQPVRQFADAPQRCVEDDVDYAAVINTNLGAVTIELFEEEAPGTVNNFVVLARWGFYDGSTFHRVIPQFVAQGGDPVGDPPGVGHPGYTIPDELPGRDAYEIGSVAMANAFSRGTGQGRNSGGSQFFIITGTSALDLPPDYSLFGKVTEGVEVVQEIDARGTPSGAPTEGVLITSVDIVER